MLLQSVNKLHSFRHNNEEALKVAVCGQGHNSEVLVNSTPPISKEQAWPNCLICIMGMWRTPWCSELASSQHLVTSLVCINTSTHRKLGQTSNTILYWL